MCAQNSTYSLFIPGFVLCTNPFLFRIKIANELSEFRNYLYKLNAFCITESAPFTAVAIAPILTQHSTSFTMAFPLVIANVLIKEPLITMTTAIRQAENTYPKKVRMYEYPTCEVWPPAARVDKAIAQKGAIR